MEIKPIKTEKDYTQALKRLEVIFSADTGTAESDEADVSGLLVDEYEKSIILYLHRIRLKPLK